MPALNLKGTESGGKKANDKSLFFCNFNLFALCFHLLTSCQKQTAQSTSTPDQ